MQGNEGTEADVDACEGPGRPVYRLRAEPWGA